MPGITENKAHALTMEDRGRIIMTGAVNVENFEENDMKIETLSGMLQLKGEGMHILKFDTNAGELEIEGKFDSLSYSEANAGKGSLMKKLFG